MRCLFKTEVCTCYCFPWKNDWFFKTWNYSEIEETKLSVSAILPWQGPENNLDYYIST